MRRFLVFSILSLAMGASAALGAPALDLEPALLAGEAPRASEFETGRRVAVPLPEGRLVVGELEREVRRSETSFTWFGRLAEGGTFLLAVEEDAIVGEIVVPGLGSFSIRPSAAGGAEIRAAEHGSMSHRACGAVPVTDLADPGSLPGERSAAADDGSVIDVLVAYTPAARSSAGGPAGIEALIHASVDQTNYDFFNSGITPRIRLVHFAETAYTESFLLETDLNRLRSQFDGNMDELHALRNAHGADLVALLVSAGDACGIAYVMTTLSPGFASSAFSVTVTTCALGHTFAHELGHNLGCFHDRDNSPPNGSLFPYSYGHRFLGQSGTEYRTVMAYAPGVRIPNFSNPDTLYDGSPTGVPIGQPLEAHNAASIDGAASTAANWRQSVCNDALPTVALVGPNGGEVLCPGTEQPVSWSTSDELSYNYLVEYSDDGGSTWFAQREGSGSGTMGGFDWTVPYLPSGQGRLRVTITNCAGAVVDSSDLDFTVASDPPVVGLTSLTGGESFCGGTAQNVEWANSAPICEAQSWVIEYSTDAGANWIEVESGSGSGGGAYSWMVPDTPTTQGRVRVTLANPAGADSDASVADFTILPAGPPAFELVSPNGGEAWEVGSQQELVWNNSSCDAVATTIRYSTNGGATWVPIVVVPGPDSGTYTWTVPDTPSSESLVSVFGDNGGGSDADTSDAFFTIVGAPSVTILAPNGGEIWVAGTDHEIRWTNSGAAASSHTIEYSLDGGGLWTPLVEDEPGTGGGTYVWTTPASPTSIAKVRVTLESALGTDVKESAATFDLAPVADFVDVSFGAVADAGVNRGVAWGDHDDDGDDDLLFTSGIFGGNVLLENDGFGDFNDATDPDLADPGADVYGATWADFDDDGDLDAYFVVFGGTNRLVRNDGGAFTDVTAPPLEGTGGGRFGIWADYDLDGDLDLYLAKLAGANQLLRNDGGTFADATSGPEGDASVGSSAVWSDYDLDGDPDLYVVNFGGANKLLRNDGGAFVDVTSGPEGDASAGVGAAWGDFDGDGDFDLYLANVSANRLLRNDASGFVDVTAGPLGEPDWTNGAAWADSDHDGDLDLYLANNGAANALLRNDGGAEFVDVTPAPLADANEGQGSAWSDVNGDGTPDLYVANSSGANKLFQNYSAGANHWLQVSLTGTNSNRMGVGARVRVVSGGVSRVRELRAGSGWVSQNSARLHFGLGGSSIADTVEVSWPGGTLQRVVSVSVDRVIAIVESGATSVVASGSPTELRLLPAFPNPFRRSTEIRFDLPATTEVRLRVFDVSGRLVRVLVNEPLTAGSHRVAWDGTNRAGRNVASGIYLYRLDAEGFARTQRVVRLK